MSRSGDTHLPLDYLDLYRTPIDLWATTMTISSVWQPRFNVIAPYVPRLQSILVDCCFALVIGYVTVRQDAAV